MKLLFMPSYSDETNTQDKHSHIILTLSNHINKKGFKEYYINLVKLVILVT